MRLKTYWHEMIDSLHDPRFYQRIFVAGEGVGVKYQFFVLSFIWLVVSLLQATILTPLQFGEPSRYLRALAPQFPAVTLENGRVKSDIGEPLLIKDAANGEPLMLIDKTGTPAALGASGAPVLLTERSVWLELQGEALEYELPPDLSGEVTGEMLEKLAARLDTYMPFIMLVVMPINIAFSLLGSLLRWLILGVAVFVLLKGRFPDIDMEKSLRVTSRAMTASMLLGVIGYGLGLPFADINILPVAVSFLYLFFAVASIKAHAPAKLK